MDSGTKPCALMDQTLLFVSGEVTEAEAETIRGHLSGCDACRAVRDALDTLGAALDRTALPPLGPERTDALIRNATRADAVVAAATTSPTESGLSTRSAIRRPARPPRLSSRLRRWRTAAAVAGITLVGGLLAAELKLTPDVGFGPGGAPDGTVGGGTASEPDSDPGAAPLSPESFATLSPIDRYTTVVQAAQGAGDNEALGNALLTLLEDEPNPNVRLAIVDALNEIPTPRDTRLLARFSEETFGPLRVDLLSLAARLDVPEVVALAERLTRSDGSAAVRRLARRILEEM